MRKENSRKHEPDVLFERKSAPDGSTVPLERLGMENHEYLDSSGKTHVCDGTHAHIHAFPLRVLGDDPFKRLTNAELAALAPDAKVSYYIEYVAVCEKFIQCGLTEAVLDPVKVDTDPFA